MRRLPLLVCSLVLVALLRSPAASADPLPIAFGQVVAGEISDPAVPLVYTFEAAPAQRVYLNFLASSAASTLNWELTDAQGRVLLSNRTALADLGPATLMGGTYSLSVFSENGVAVGPFEFSLHSPVDQSFEAAIGDVLEGAITVPGQVTRYTFAAAQGQRVMLDQLSATSIGRLNWSLADAAGREILSRTADLADQGPFTLQAGQHTLTIFGEGDAVASWSVQLAAARVDERAIELGEVVAGSIAGPGDEDVYTFAAAPGQRIYVQRLRADSYSVINWSLVDERGLVLQARTTNVSSFGPLDLAGGTYTLRVVGEGGATSGYEFVVHPVTDLAADLALDEVVADRIEIGQRHVYSFSSAPGQAVTLDLLSSSSYALLDWTLERADGLVLLARTSNLSDAGPFILAGGQYRLTIEGEAAASEDYELRVATVTDTRAPVVVDGPPVAGEVAVPGQRAEFSFVVAPRAGELGRLVTLDQLQTSNLTNLNWILSDARGRTLLARTTSLADQGPLPLLSGSYVLSVVGERPMDTGSFEFQLVDGGPAESVPPGTPIALGQVVQGQIVAANEPVSYTFELVQDTLVFCDLLVGASYSSWTLTDALGHPVFSGQGAQNSDTQDLGPYPLGPGSYTLSFVNTRSAPAFSFRVLAATERSFAAALEQVILGETTTPGDRDVYTFDLAADTEVFFDLLAGHAYLEWSLTGPQGQLVFGPLRAATASTQNVGPLPLAAGHYSLALDPLRDDVGAYSFQMRAVVRGERAITVDEPVADRVAVPGSSWTYTLDLAAPQRLFFDLEQGFGSLRWTLEDPAGHALFASANAHDANSYDQGPFSLPAGRHTLRFDPLNDVVGDFAFRVRPVAEAPPRAIAVDELIEDGFAAPGEVRSYALTLAQPARLFFDSRVLAVDAYWSLRSPVGEWIWREVRLNDLNSRDQGPLALLPGTYTLSVRNAGDDLGSFGFIASSVVDVDGGELEIGAVVDGALPAPGTVVTYRFHPERHGQALILDLLSTSPGLRWSVLDPVGQPVFSWLRAENWATRDQGPFPLAMGVYSLELDGEADYVPSYTFRIRPADGGAGPPQGGCASCRALDIVFVFDTSASMAPYADSVCQLATDIVAGLAAQGVPTTAQYWGISDTALIPCVTTTVLEVLGPEVPGDPPPELALLGGCSDGGGGPQENFGPATAIVAERNDWAPDAVRLVIPVADEGAYCGVPMNELDDLAIDLAAEVARSNEVVVSPIAPSAANDPFLVSLLRLAAATGGQASTAANDAAELLATVTGIASSACSTETEDVRPRLVELTPDGSAPLAAGRPLTLAGRVAPVNWLRPIVAVLIDGAPVARLDASGRFFHTVVLEPGDNAFTIEMVEECGSFSQEISLGARTPGDWMSSLVELAAGPVLVARDTTFVEPTRQLQFEGRARNDGAAALEGPLLLVVGPGRHPSVKPVSPAGVTAAGEPYFAMLAAGATLAPGESGPAATLAFHTPNRAPVRADDLRWLGPANAAPYFTSLPRLVAAAGELYAYSASAEDPQGQALSFALPMGPAEMSIDGVTGELRWSVPDDAEGSFEVAVAVSDGHGATALQRFTLVVAATGGNRPPTFTSLPLTHAAVGATYAYAASAADPDGDPVRFELMAGPEGLSVSEEGQVLWRFALPGHHEVALRVVDDQGGQAAQSYLLSVGEHSANLSGPLFTSAPPVQTAVGELYVYQPLAFDPDGDRLEFSLLSAPEGVVFDPATGRLGWVAAPEDVGQHLLTLTVDDGRGSAATQSWLLEVLAEAPNLPPWFASLPPPLAVVGQPYTYEALAVDPEGGAVTYAQVAGPAGLICDPATGQVTWTPTPDEVGAVTVALRARDTSTAAAEQVFVLRVRASNAPPAFATEATPQARADAAYRYFARALDPDGDEVAYELRAGPEGMAVDARWGVVTWAPGAGDVGLHPVTLRASDALGAAAEQRWELEVLADTEPPVVEVVIHRWPACIGEPVTVCAPAADDGALVSVELAADGVPLGLDAEGCAQLTVEAAGTVALRARALDGAGNEGVAAAELDAFDCDDEEVPVVTLHSPALSEVLVAPTDLIVSIDDNTPAVLSWTVELAPHGSDEWTLLASGEGPVSGDAVATLDPTVLPNDDYDLRVLARDGAHEQGFLATFGVGGHFKVGNYSVSFVDLLVRLGGIPLSVTRTYDSLDPSPGDFGAGWRLGLSGRVWDTQREVRGHDLAALLSTEPFTDTSRVYVTKPDGQRVGFTFAPEPLSMPQLGQSRVRFEPDPGVDDTLEAVGPATVWNWGSGYLDYLIPYNPSVYVLTTHEGTRYTLDEERGLVRVQDVLGNSIEVSPDGLLHSSGLAVRFERDAAGRITRTSEPDEDPDDEVAPPTRRYEYDAAGNLVASYDPLGHPTRYRYEDPVRPHALTGIDDPLGRPIQRLVYGAEGRLVAQCGPSGDPETLAGCVTVAHDLGAGLTSTTDALGHRTDRFLDERGNTVLERRWLDDDRVVDQQMTFNDDDRLTHYALGELSVAYVYDERGRLLSMTEPGDRTTTWTYGRCVSPERVTNPLGDSLSYTYDERCALASATDALGAVTRFSRNERGDLVEVLDAVGDRWTFGYDGRGRQTSLRDPTGAVLTMEYDARGDLVATTDRRGRRVELAYDDAHRLIRETWDTDPPRVTTYVWADDGRLLSASDPDSTVTLTYHPTGRIAAVDTAGTPGAPPVLLTVDWDAVGQLRQVTDSLGGVTRYEYDALRRPTAIAQWGEGVRGKRLEIEYDAAQRTSGFRRYADAQGALEVIRSSAEYDEALPDRLVALRHRRAADDGPLHDIELSRDAFGNVVGVVDAEGGHEYTVDGMQRIVAAAHPAAGPQPDELYRYDGLGNRLSSHLSQHHRYGYMGGSGGSRLLEDDRYDYAYDEDGRVVARRAKADGAALELDWDHRGRLVEQRERGAGGELRRTVHYTYDAFDRRIRIDDDDSAVQHLIYDGGNPILVLSGGGEVASRRLYGRGLDTLYAEERGGQTLWLLTDPSGTVRDVVDDDAELLAHYVYDSFGQRLEGPAPGVVSELGFHARPADPETGLMDFRARSYDPWQGRFLSEDPLAPHHYRFAEGNPLVFRDPTGTCVAIEYACLASEAAGVATSFAANIAIPVYNLFMSVAGALEGLNVSADVGALTNGIAGGLAGGMGPAGNLINPPKDADSLFNGLLQGGAAAFCAGYSARNSEGDGGNPSTGSPPTGGNWSGPSWTK